MNAVRVMLWVQHLLGIGHQQRAAAICRSLCEQGCEVLYASGGVCVPGLDTGPARFLQLPPTRAANARYEGLVDEAGEPVSKAWKTQRTRALLEAFSDFAPEVLVIESFPFGRRLLRFELLPLLERALGQTRVPLIVSSIRDVLEARSTPERNQETVECLRRYFDSVLVHADPRVVTLAASFPLAERIDDMLHYTGYVVAARPAAAVADGVGEGEILVSAGGGVVSEELLAAAFEARALGTAPQPVWRCLVGHSLPTSAYHGLLATAPEGVVVERNRPDFTDLLARCAVSVSQAGCNTVLEIVRARARAVVVPYSEAGEREQLLRARLFARLGLLDLIEPGDLSAQTLRARVDSALWAPRPGAADIDSDGARNSAKRIVALVEKRRQLRRGAGAA